MEKLLITDAYADPRFNSGVDALTGFRTRNMICEPVHTSGGFGYTLAVVQMINKLSDEGFDESDQRILSSCVSKVS